jgi:hypothetical protein
MVIQPRIVRCVSRRFGGTHPARLGQQELLVERRQVEAPAGFLDGRGIMPACSDSQRSASAQSLPGGRRHACPCRNLMSPLPPVRVAVPLLSTQSPPAGEQAETR